VGCGDLEFSSPGVDGNEGVESADHGSFEYATGIAPNSTLSPGATNLTGWTVIGGGNLTWCDSCPYCEVPASNGNYSLDLTGLVNMPPYEGVSQTINTVLGVQYQLLFDLSGRYDSIPVSVLATAGASSQTFTNSDLQEGFYGWATETLPFTGTGGPTVISLLGTFAGGDDPDLSIDNVIVTPEPATWAMMLVGIAGLGAAMRRQRAGSGQP